MRTHANAAFVALLAVVAALLGSTAGRSAPPADAASSVIVPAADAASAQRLVAAAGGTVTHDLGIIRAVGARLTAAQRDRLAGFRVSSACTTTAAWASTPIPRAQGDQR